jgi:hypothetical protein
MPAVIPDRSPLIDDPSNYLWRISVTLAGNQHFHFSTECAAKLREQIKSGLEVHRVGLYEFKERCTEAEANLAKLVEYMIAEQIAHQPASRILPESVLFNALHHSKLCPGLWPFC